MVLYFVDEVIGERQIPQQLIDPNVQIDYKKLRYLITIDKKLNGNFDRLKSVLEKGEVKAKLVESFPLDRLLDPNNFYSLLYYFGLLTIKKMVGQLSVLKIPNQAVKQLMFEYIRDVLQDTDHFRIDLWKFAEHIHEMAFNGVWEPVFDFIAEQIKAQTTIRDYLHNEKVIQGFLAAYLNVTDYFVCYTEPELNNKYADLLLEPLLIKYSDIKYGCLAEIKYINRTEFTKTTLQKKINEAKKQIKSYLKDPFLLEKTQGKNLIKLILVFNGWELVHKEEIS